MLFILGYLNMMFCIHGKYLDVPLTIRPATDLGNTVYLADKLSVAANPSAYSSNVVLHKSGGMFSRLKSSKMSVGGTPVCHLSDDTIGPCNAGLGRPGIKVKGKKFDIEKKNEHGDYTISPSGSSMCLSMPAMIMSRCDGTPSQLFRIKKADDKTDENLLGETIDLDNDPDSTAPADGTPAGNPAGNNTGNTNIDDTRTGNTNTGNTNTGNTSTAYAGTSSGNSSYCVDSSGQLQYNYPYSGQYYSNYCVDSSGTLRSNYPTTSYPTTSYPTTSYPTTSYPRCAQNNYNYPSCTNSYAPVSTPVVSTPVSAPVVSAPVVSTPVSTPVSTQTTNPVSQPVCIDSYGTLRNTDTRLSLTATYPPCTPTQSNVYNSGNSYYAYPSCKDVYSAVNDTHSSTTNNDYKCWNGSGVERVVLNVQMPSHATTNTNVGNTVDTGSATSTNGYSPCPAGTLLTCHSDDRTASQKPCTLGNTNNVCYVTEMAEDKPDPNTEVELFNPAYAQTAPVYTQTAPMYAQAAPVYAQAASTYVQSQPMMVQSSAPPLNQSSQENYKCNCSGKTNPNDIYAVINMNGGPNIYTADPGLCASDKTQNCCLCLE